MDNKNNLTYIYFIRHAESDYSVKDSKARPLTEQGVKDAQELAARFADIPVAEIYSSPYKRAVDTMTPIADTKGMSTTIVDDLRERESDSVQTISTPELIRKQWNDFTYTLSDGENYKSVQERNIKALQTIIGDNKNKTILIGTHGIALCTIIHYFRPSIDEVELAYILKKMPYLLLMKFSDGEFQSMEEVM